MIRGKRFAQPEGLLIRAVGVADSGCGSTRQHSNPSATADDRTPIALTDVTISVGGAHEQVSTAKSGKERLDESSATARGVDGRLCPCPLERPSFPEIVLGGAH